MDVQTLGEKLRQFCLWFFWEREWSQEKILTLAGLILLVIVLRMIIKRTYRVKPVRTAKVIETCERKNNWRTG
jgi:hypothetical protein